MSVNEVQRLERRLKRNVANKTGGGWQKLIHNNENQRNKATGFLGESFVWETVATGQCRLRPGPCSERRSAALVLGSPVLISEFTVFDRQLFRSAWRSEPRQLLGSTVKSGILRHRYQKVRKSNVKLKSGSDRNKQIKHTHAHTHRKKNNQPRVLKAT